MRYVLVGVFVISWLFYFFFSPKSNEEKKMLLILAFFGVAYYSNGNKYREGIFGRRGMIEGKEFYSNGKIKFEGILKYPGYGPIYPTMGNLYNEDGELIFSGKFEVKKGGVGFPMVKYPKYYRFNEKDRPEIEYL